MPNAINRFKPNQLASKLEKENQLKEIRGKLVAKPPGKGGGGSGGLSPRQLRTAAQPKAETVWERLSKVKKSASNEENLGSHSSKSRTGLRASGSHRLAAVRRSRSQGGKKTSATPLSPHNINTNPSLQPTRSHHGEKNHCEKNHGEKKTPKKSSSKKSKSETTGSKPTQTIKEILTARSMCNSKSSSNESRRVELLTTSKPATSHFGCQVSPPGGDIFLELQDSSLEALGPLELPELPEELMRHSAHQGSQGSDDYEMAPLMSNSALESTSSHFTPSSPFSFPSPASSSPHNCSVQIKAHIESLLLQRGQHSVDAEEVKLVKNVIKTDERHRQLHAKGDERLFKDILKTQLCEILRQGSAVRSVLSKLDSSDSDSTAKTQTESGLEQTSVVSTRDLEQQQVDVIFKNVPTLEKEIIILRALGEKLEATLKRTASQRQLRGSSVGDLTNTVTTASNTITTAINTTTTASNTNSIANIAETNGSKTISTTSTSIQTTKRDAPTQLPKPPTYSPKPPTYSPTQSPKPATHSPKPPTYSPSHSPKPRTHSPKPLTLLPEPPPPPPPAPRERCLHHALQKPFAQRAWQAVRPIGVRLCIGLAKEFHIANKTIVELKAEADRHFYLPINCDRLELKRTSFKKLKRNPNVLMRHLKPKNSQVAFNVLDQDQMFFNSFLFNVTNEAALSTSWPKSMELSASSSGDVGGSRADDWAEDSDSCSVQMQMHEGGDSRMIVRGAEKPSLEAKILEVVEKPSQDLETCREIKPKVSFMEPLIKVGTEAEKEEEAEMRKMQNGCRDYRKQPHRIRRTASPMPMDRYLEPKSHLLRTIIVGSVQISVFLLLIMAITYPDMKC